MKKIIVILLLCYAAAWAFSQPLNNPAYLAPTNKNIVTKKGFGVGDGSGTDSFYVRGASVFVPNAYSTLKVDTGFGYVAQSSVDTLQFLLSKNLGLEVAFTNVTYSNLFTVSSDADLGTGSSGGIGIGSFNVSTGAQCLDYTVAGGISSPGSQINGAKWFKGYDSTGTANDNWIEGFSPSVIKIGSGALITTYNATGIGIGATPSAYLTIKAGTTAASSAPLKFTSGTLQTTAEAGAVEFLTDKGYLTITTGAARKEITLNDAALTSGTIPIATTNGRLTNSALTSTNLLSGTYTPTLTRTANIDSSFAYLFQYLRVGNTVTVSGRVDIDATLTATPTTLGISIPIASNFTSKSNCAGTSFAADITGMGAAITGNTANDRADQEFVSTDIALRGMWMTFTYVVQ